MSTFTNFKDKFYSRFSDPAIFDCAEFNLVKVVLDGLKVDYASKGKIRTFIFFPLPIFKLVLFFKRILRHLKIKKSNQLEINSLANFKNRKYLILELGQFLRDENEKAVSAFFHYIIEIISRKNTTVFLEAQVNEAYDFDFFVPTFYALLSNTPLSKLDKELRLNLLKSYRSLEKLSIFNQHELENIRISIDKFFITYRVWNQIFKVIEPKIAYLICHYHREGFLLALKRNNITSIELQHGLIAPEDIFYMMNPVLKPIAKRALFPEKIFVFGDFWKQRLLKGSEFSEEQIEVIGYYCYERKKAGWEIKSRLEGIVGDKHIILVTTQTKMHDYFISYINWLKDDIKKRKLNYVILIKPHPAEAKNTYDIIHSDNCHIVYDNLEILFAYADIHISIYSTTLFDSIRFNVPSFSINFEPFKDYISSMLDAGITKLIQPNQNPIDLLSHSQINQYSLHYYYDNFKPGILL